MYKVTDQRWADAHDKRNLNPFLCETSRQQRHEQTQYNIAGALYSFFDKGNYTKEDKNGKKTGTWKCDTEGFVELDGKQKLGKPFQWKPSPTEEDVRDGKQLLRYGMMGDFVKKVQEKLKLYKISLQVQIHIY